MDEIPVRIRRERRPYQTAVIVAAVAVLVVAVAAALSVFQVSLGEVAVVVDPLLHSVGRPIVGPAIAFKPPWAYVVKDIVGVEAIDMFYEPPRDYPAIEALTSDGVLVQVDVTVRYRLIPEKFDLLVREYPRLNYEEDFIVSTSRQVIREVVANYSLTSIIEKRDAVARHAEAALAGALKSDPVIGACIEFLGVNLRNIKLPTEVLNAINEKIAAQQRAIKAEYERQATLIQANATAQGRLIQADAEARALLVVAEAQAKSILFLANVTGVEPSEVLAYYFYLQAVKEMAQSGRAVLIASPSGFTPLISVPAGEG